MHEPIPLPQQRPCLAVKTMVCVLIVIFIDLRCHKYDDDYGDAKNAR